MFDEDDNTLVARPILRKLVDQEKLATKMQADIKKLNSTRQLGALVIRYFDTKNGE